MANVTIASQVTDLPWSLPTPPRIRVYVENPFMTVDGIPVLAANPFGGGKAFVDKPCTLDASNQVIVPEISLPPSTNSLDAPNARPYKAYLYTKGSGSAAGQYSEFSVFASPFAVNHADPTQTWEEVRAFNLGTLPAATPHNASVSGNLTVGGAITGNGAGLTGIGSGTGGVINTGSTTIGADSGAGGTGVIDLQSRGQTRARIENAGDVTLIGSSALKMPGAVYTPAGVQLSTPANPVIAQTTNTTIGTTGATNEGFRRGVICLVDKNLSDVNTVLIQIDQVQTSNPGTGPGLDGKPYIMKTGLHVKHYSLPDNGADTSGGLFVETGGGSSLTTYKVSALRPTGLTNYFDSPQGAFEAGCGDGSQAILALSGSFDAATFARDGAHYASNAIYARIDNAVSKGILIAPGDDVFDSRVAFTIGRQTINGADTLVKLQMLLDGSMRNFLANSNSQILDATSRHIHKTSNTDGYTIALVKARAGGGAPALLGDTVGKYAWNFLNGAGTPVEVNGGQLVGTVVSPTAGAESMELKFQVMHAGVLEQPITLHHNNVIMGAPNLVPASVRGFVYIPVVAGTPTGTPTSYAGREVILLDSSGSKIWVRLNGTWKSVAVA